MNTDIPPEIITPELILPRVAGLSGPLNTIGVPGGFKKTMRGRWNGCDVAVQVHFRHSPERLPRETEAMRSVESRYVAKLLEEMVLDIEGYSVPVYICEFIEGRTLGQFVREEGSLTPQQVVRLGAGISSGLHAIHLKNLVHRDIKPENIMVRSDGRPAILDLSVAKHLDKTTVTAAGSNPGTLGWMAPEQCLGDVRVDRRCDLFALGLVLFYAASGRSPFSGGDLDAIQQSILTDAPEILSEEFGTLVELVGRLLHKKPYGRPRWVADVVEQLEGMLGSER